MYSQKTKSSLISCLCSRAYGESIGDIPASYVSLPEGTPHVWQIFTSFFPINVGKHASMRHLEFRDWQTQNFKTFKLTCFSITNDLVFDPEILLKR